MGMIRRKQTLPSDQISSDSPFDRTVSRSDLSITNATAFSDTIRGQFSIVSRSQTQIVTDFSIITTNQHNFLDHNSIQQIRFLDDDSRSFLSTPQQHLRIFLLISAQMTRGQLGRESSARSTVGQRIAVRSDMLFSINSRVNHYFPDQPSSNRP
ncbi:unnamed protein product [Arabidopsis halleri]